MRNTLGSDYVLTIIVSLVIERRVRLAQEAQAKHGSLQSWRGVKLVLLAWIAMLGFDFFLHGGLLAGLYLQPGPFLLPPLEAARRIPLGYVGFLIAAAFLVWIIFKINVRGWREGLVAGAVIGGSMGASLALGKRRPKFGLLL